MKTIYFLLMFLLAGRAFAYTVETKPGAQIFLSIPDAAKATLEFSEPVKWVSGTSKFSVEAVAAEVDEKTRAIVDPQVFEVKPVTGGAEEAVTFVFQKRDTSPRTLVIRFRTRASASTYYRIKFPKPMQEQDFKGFLKSETKLMVAMIADEESNAREVLSLPVKLESLKDVKLKAIRRFEKNGLVGYVFSVTNDSKLPVTLNLNDFRFGKQNQAVLAHVDNENLVPCTRKNVDACQTQLRIVARGEGDATELMMRNASFPFSTQSNVEAP